jgi:hypothetical protein
MQGRRSGKTGGVFAGIQWGLFRAEKDADGRGSFAAVGMSKSDRLLQGDVRPRLLAVRLGMICVVDTRTILLVDSEMTVAVRNIIRVGRHRVKRLHDCRGSRTSRSGRGRRVPFFRSGRCDVYSREYRQCPSVRSSGHTRPHGK